MNNQEAFDHVVTSLRKQGKQSVDATGTCLYRGPNDCKCAAGHLIPDELYVPAMEGRTIGSVLGVYNIGAPEYPALTAHLQELDTALLEALQRVHDGNGRAGYPVPHWEAGYPVPHWEAGFALVAKNHNLVYTPLV